MNQVPAIRFAGFTDPWEQRKLGEMGTTFSGLSGKAKEDFGHGAAEYITYVNVFSNPIANSDGIENIEVDDRQNKVRYGDVLFTTSSETPEEVAMSSVWLMNRENVYLNSFCFGWRPTVEVVPLYLAYMLRSPVVRKKLTLLAQGISRYNVSKIKVMELAASMPTLDEQALIGSFFRDLDDLITLHQRKYDQFVVLKKALLEKMFPRDNASVPEIRFAGFTDPWEQRKLGEFDIKTGPFGSTLHAEDYVAHGTPIVTTEHFKGGELPFVSDGIPQVSDHDTARLGQYRLQKHDIVFSRVGSVDLNAEVKDEQAGWLFSGRVLRLRTDGGIDSKYLHYELGTDRVRSSMIERAVGLTMASINTGILEDTVFFAPVSITEQRKIGALLASFDSLIALHQRKLTLLRSLKAACLEKMFV